MMTFCTLFNVNYIDKALTMVESIERYTTDYVLYVLSMDNRCFEILTDLDLPRVKPIRLVDFENEELLAVKSTRSMGEYCWTCSSALVDYVMRTFQPESCSYIDSDLYFYDDPHCILEEMKRRNASVQITGHRFNSYDAKKMSWRVGTYCVEFNTFLNNKEGRELLDIWRRQCLEYCKCDGDGIHWADQKYMDNWVSDYPYAIETENLGAGIAPWNIAQYRMLSQNEHGPTKVKCRGKEYKPLFYHFQSMTYLDEHSVKSNTAGYWGVDKKLVQAFYLPYVKHIARNKQMLKEKYGVEVLLRRHPGVAIASDKSIGQRIFHKMQHLFDSEYWASLLYHRMPSLLSSDKGIVRF